MLALRYDSRSVVSVAAKIGYALFCTVMRRKVEEHRRRGKSGRHILGTETFLSEPVSITPDRYHCPPRPKIHIILSSRRGTIEAPPCKPLWISFSCRTRHSRCSGRSLYRYIVCGSDGSGIEDCFEAELPGLRGPNGNCGIFSAMARGRPARLEANRREPIGDVKGDPDQTKSGQRSCRGFAAQVYATLLRVGGLAWTSSRSTGPQFLGCSFPGFTFICNYWNGKDTVTISC